ncbi:MAG: CAAX prenyl protease-related protein [Armatimonadota bacterium]
MDRPAKATPDWLPYVLPMALFLGLTALEGQSPANYVWIYFAKVAVVVAALVWAKPTWRDIKFDAKQIPLAVVVGLVLFAVWVGIERIAYPHLGQRTAYNPFEKIPDAGLRTAFIAVRFFGLALLVPFMEELFWRSFGLRYASQSNFNDLAIGTFTMTGAAICCAVFAFAHPEWIPGLIFAASMTALLWKTKSVFACVVAHAVTNLALGIYVITQGAWSLW